MRLHDHAIVRICVDRDDDYIRGVDGANKAIIVIVSTSWTITTEEGSRSSSSRSRTRTEGN